jgi:hypothetical protein
MRTKPPPTFSSVSESPSTSTLVMGRAGGAELAAGVGAEAATGTGGVTGPAEVATAGVFAEAASAAEVGSVR